MATACDIIWTELIDPLPERTRDHLIAELERTEPGRAAQLAKAAERAPLWDDDDEAASAAQAMSVMGQFR